MSVDATFAQWLRSAALIAINQDATVLAAWAALATVSEITSPLALSADAAAEAARQEAFLKYPLAIDVIEVPGRREDTVGRRLHVVAKGGGYDAGVDVFVIEARPADGVDRTVLKVLRRLA